MPRRARIGAGGVLQDIICQGIERRYIFRDDADLPSSLDVLGCAERNPERLYRLALIPNQFMWKDWAYARRR